MDGLPLKILKGKNDCPGQKMHENVIPIYIDCPEAQNLANWLLGAFDALEKNFFVIQLYIRVSVVLSKSLCRKEREKLDITLDSMVVMLARV